MIRTGILVLLFGIFLMPIVLFAQGFDSQQTGLTDTANQAGFSTNLACSSSPQGCIPYFIGAIVNGLLGVFGAIFLALIMWGGLRYMLSQGEKDQVQKAKDTIKNAILGMVVVALSYTIANFVLNTISDVTGSGSTVIESNQ